jgi:hypothetical protein
MGYLCGYLAFMAGIFFFLYSQLQPATIVNAGQAAYVPPPQTRLIPLARKMDAPELAEITPLNSSLEALAKVEDTPTSSSNDSSRRAKKRHHTETAQRETRRRYAYEGSAYYRSYDRSWQRSYRSWWEPTRTAYRQLHDSIFDLAPSATVLDAHAGLLGTDVLHVESENAGELGEVIDITPGLDQLEHIARLDGRPLLLVEAVFAAIGLLVLDERSTVLRAVEGEAHPVERQTLLRLVSVEHGGAGNVLRHRDALLTGWCRYERN